MHSFQLAYTKDCPAIRLRELTGREELVNSAKDTMDVLPLLNQIMMPVSEAGELKAEKIVIADRDYLLAGVYRFTYGPRIQSVTDCAACHQAFDIDFLLPDWISQVRKEAQETVAGEDGFYQTAEGIRYRLPDGEDEIAVWGLPPDLAEARLLQRCVNGPVNGENARQVQQAMAEQAPVLLADMQAVCPECGERQTVRFDMQSFLLARLRNEKKRVAAEVHCIAMAYRWSHREILDLPRSLRKTYVQLIGFD